MRHAFKNLAILALLCGAVLAAGPGPALATDGACSVSEAHAYVHAAERDLARAQARLREARRVESATRLYSGQYGARVGRWVRAARRVGWQWSELPTLMLVIRTESGGDPNAWSGYYAGLMQFGRPWWEGKWDPFRGPTNLAHGERAQDVNGWAPWPWVRL